MKRSAELCFLVAALALLLLARTGLARFNPGTDTAAQLSDPAPADGFTVAILADRTAGAESGLAVLEQAVAEINLIRPAFVVHIGDLVPGYLRDLDRWEEDIERVKAVLDKLEVPLFPLAGNHDVITGTDNPEDHRGEELHQRHFGPLYYSFDHRGAHFICLYTEESLRSAPRMGRRQLDWLREDLSGTAARHVFVLMHKPLWEYPDAGWDAVHAMLREHPVRAVIAGHFHHYYKSQQRDGIQYYVLGVTGGQIFSPELAGGLEHYCLLRVEPDAYRLALVKPGHILPDDYIQNDDFKNMERLRFLSREETGVAAAIRSPELRPVDGRVAVIVTNPLDRPMRVTVRGIARGGRWAFRPPARSLLIGAGGRQYAYLGVRSEPVSSEELVVPEVEVQYTYVDGRGRSVPIVLRRRVPLDREAVAPLSKASIALDARAAERAWRAAPVLTTAVWQAGPFETGESGPVFRVIPTLAGIYFYAESADAFVSDFHGERILSDAVFLGALPGPGDNAAGDLTVPPVVVIFPFGPTGAGQAVRAYWDPKRAIGAEAEGVHVVGRVLEGGKGWRCEGLVPWDVLLSDPVPPSGEVRFNIGAWDNDGDLFSELHSWAPTGNATQWGRLILQSPEGD